MNLNFILEKLQGRIPPELYCYIEGEFHSLADLEKKAQAALAENAAMRSQLEKNNEYVALMERQLALLQKTLTILEGRHE